MMMSLTFLAQQQVEKIVEVKWLSRPADWITFLILLAIWGFAFGLYLLERRTSPLSVRMICAFLLASFLTATLFVLYDPVQEEYTIESHPSTVFLAIDTSNSMSFSDKYPAEMKESLSQLFPSANLDETSRLDLVKKALGDEAFTKLLAENNLVLYSFDSHRAEQMRASLGDSSHVMSAGMTLMRPEGDVTRIGDALNQVLNDLRGERIAAAILISDGQQNSGLITTEQVARRMQGKGIPLFTVGVGNPYPSKDISLEDLVCPELVIVDNIVKLDLKVLQRGYRQGTGSQVNVTIEPEGGDATPVAQQSFELGPEDQAISIEIKFKADQQGTFRVTATVEGDEEELTVKNNSLHRRLEVLDRKIRVLYVDGLPRWEYRYLKNGLIRDASIAAQCFLASADPSFPQESSPGLDALKGYPLSKEELFEYDVIVFGDLNPDMLSDAQHKITAEFVTEHGGGILFLAGEDSMPSRYDQSEIANLFPFRLERSEEDSLNRGPLTKSFPLQLTLLGKDHVISKLDDDAEMNARLWSTGGSGFPGQLWHYPIREPKPQAKVLITHPFEKTSGGKAQPLVLTTYLGMGTVMFQAVDELWRWRARGVAYFEKYYGQAIQWLASSRLKKSTRYAITTDKSIYALGEKVRITATVRDAQQQPATEDTQTLRIIGEDGFEPMLLDKVAERPGDYEGTYIPTKTGPFRVAIVADTGSEAEELVHRDFDVVIPRRESQDRKLNREALAAMAEVTGGAYYDLADWKQLIESSQIGSAPERHKESSEVKKLWDHWWVLAGLIGLVTIEWVLRKVIKLV